MQNRVLIYNNTMDMYLEISHIETKDFIMCKLHQYCFHIMTIVHIGIWYLNHTWPKGESTWDMTDEVSQVHQNTSSDKKTDWESPLANRWAEIRKMRKRTVSEKTGILMRQAKTISKMYFFNVFSHWITPTFLTLQTDQQSGLNWNHNTRPLAGFTHI